MKKIAWLVPILIAGPLAFAPACGGTPTDEDGSGGNDGDTGGNSSTGGNGNDGSGGIDGTGGSTGGTDAGGMGGMGGNAACAEPNEAEIGMGGFGGDGGELTELCEARCSYAAACVSGDCNEEDCVLACSETYAYYYEYCMPEYTALKACEVENLIGEDYACEDGGIFATSSGVEKCETESDVLNACLAG